jgi:23S rRNA G2445 N2-methylase RlmL
MSDHEQSIHYWAVVTRGLEQVARDEIVERVANAAAVEASYRRVAFATDVEAEALLRLHTLDDVFVDLGQWAAVPHTRAALAMLGDRALDLDLHNAAAICRDVRELGTPPTFSVTANFVGRRNYSTDEIRQAISSGIEASHHWEFQERDADADLNVRVFLEHQQVFLGVRLARTPLHERPYKIATIAGSLKPTVAAAMVRIGGFAPGAHILDPLCGAGTIPLEAALMGLEAIGGDQDPAALDAARQNRAAANVRIELEQWDARALPLENDAVDGVVCNLPWGRQIAVEDHLAAFYKRCLGEMARVVRPDGRLVLLTSLAPLLRAAVEGTELILEAELEVSVSGQTPIIATYTKPT